MTLNSFNGISYHMNNRRFGKLIGYGKLVDGRLEYAPKVIRKGGALIVKPGVKDLLEAGYLPIYDNPPEAEEGHYVVPAGWAEVDGRIERQYQQVPIPETVHTYKKSYMAQWLYRNGKWDEFKELLESSEDAKFYWETSTEFDSNHPAWGEISEGIRLGLGLDEAEFKRFLTAGETGDIMA